MHCMRRISSWNRCYSESSFLSLLLAIIINLFIFLSACIHLFIFRTFGGMPVANNDELATRRKARNKTRGSKHCERKSDSCSMARSRENVNKAISAECEKCGRTTPRTYVPVKRDSKLTLLQLLYEHLLFACSRMWKVCIYFYIYVEVFLFQRKAARRGCMSRHATRHCSPERHRRSCDDQLFNRRSINYRDTQRFWGRATENPEQRRIRFVFYDPEANNGAITLLVSVFVSAFRKRLSWPF